MESTVEPLPNSGIMGARVRHHDWASTSLGPIATWSQSLKSLVDLVLAAPLPMNLLWGPELIQIYNDAYAPLMGLKHLAGLGQPAAECWHEVWEVAGPLYERVFAGETVVLENSQWILNRHGVPEAAWFDNYLTPVLDENGAVGGALVIAFETIGRVKAAVERDRSEQALRASEQRLQRVIETDAVGMIFFDHSGTLVDANDVFLNMTGYTRAEVGRRELTWRRLTPAEWVGVSEEQMQKLAATGRIGPYEKEYILKDGSHRWMLFAGRDLGDGTTAEYCFDITARKQAEIALQVSETRLQAAIDLVGLSPYTWDPATGALDWDARLKAMWGLPPDAPVDHEVWLSGIHPEDRAQVDAALAHCIDPTGDGLYAIEYRVIGIGDGIERWVSTQGRTTFENGQPVGFTGVALEITKRKRAEAALRESEAKLALELDGARQLQRISSELIPEQSPEALYEQILAAMMAIMRSQAASMQILDPETGTLKLMAAQGFHPDAAAFWQRVDADSASACGEALRAGRRILVSDIEACEFMVGTGDLEAYCRSNLRAVQSTPLVSRTGRALGMVSTHWREPHEPDADDFSRFDVLTRQAADLIERSQTEAALRESEERFRQFAENSRSVLWILDLATMNLEYLSPAFEAIWGETIATTLGEPSRWSRFIHPDDRQRVFDALDRVRLGEAFTAEFRIVRSDGVVRWIRDTFFPIRDAQGRIRLAGGVAQDITRHDGRFVYVVDADEPSRQTLTRGLRDAGYNVRAFPSGKAFLEAAPALAAGCVVLDIRQPDAGGLTIPRELKARRIGLPVIVLGDAKGDVTFGVQVMKAGAVDFLPVPHAPDELLAALASAAADISQADEHDQEANRARGRMAEMPVREREVLDGLLLGQTNKQIGLDIDISPRTVETHRAHVMQRLGARTVPELVRIAALAGMHARG